MVEFEVGDVIVPLVGKSSVRLQPPFSDKTETHALCTKQLQFSLKEIKSEMEKLKTDG